MCVRVCVVCVYMSLYASVHVYGVCLYLYIYIYIYIYIFIYIYIYIYILLSRCINEIQQYD